ncbi:MAG TPA: hypothetical protein PKE30_01615 [Niabella sp.]|nr:hypothetical protein [Niabella sp.]
MKKGRKNKKALSVVRLVFEKINLWIEKHQRRIAGYLNQRCAHFSTKQLTIGLIGFILLFGSSIAFTIWNSLESFGSSSKAASISVPQYISIKNSNDTVLLKTSELEMIQRFRKQLDSLKDSKSGQQIIDKMKMFRPGLLDSLKQLEVIYQLKPSENEK